MRLERVNACHQNQSQRINHDKKLNLMRIDLALLQDRGSKT